MEGHLDNEINHKLVSQLILPRQDELNKYQCGKVLLVAGAANMIGAGILATRGAYRSGAGLVYLATNKNLIPIAQQSCIEAICKDYKEMVNKDISSFDALGFGPGMATNLEIVNLVEHILTNYIGKVVIDADGLNCIANSEKLQESLRTTRASVVLTPHLREAHRLMGNEVKLVDKKEIALYLADRFNCSVVVKGSHSVVYIKNSRSLTLQMESTAYKDRDYVFVNTTGNSGMATAGAGDVLAGVITSLAGQGLTIGEATVAGVYLHGRAGDLAKERIGEYGIIASDIVDNLPFSIKEIVEK